MDFVLGSGPRVHALRAHRQQFSERQQRVRGDAAQRRDRSARVGAHANYHHRRHRFVGWLDDGLIGSRSGLALARLALEYAIGCRNHSADRITRWSTECTADCPLQSSSIDRDSWHVLSLSRHRRGPYTRHRELLWVSAIVSLLGTGIREW